MPASAHRRDERLEGVHQAEDVGLEDVAKRGRVLFELGERAVGNARVGDHDVGQAVALDELGGGRAHGGRIANVRLVGVGGGK